MSCDGAEVYERRKKVSRTERNEREERKGEQSTTDGGGRGEEKVEDTGDKRKEEGH